MTINLRTREGWDDLKRVLDDRMFDVLLKLGLPDPKGNGTIVMCDPTGGDNSPSFTIWTKRAGGLSWKRWGTEYQGKTLELIAYINGWYGLKNRGADEAARWAIDKLGLGTIDDRQLQRDRAAAQEKRVDQERAWRKERERRQAASFKTFIEARPILGTKADDYLCIARGINLHGEPFIGPRGGQRVPHALRFLAHHKHIARDKSGQKLGETFWPCLIAACVDADMKIRAIHQTWLHRDFAEKAPVTPARKVFGDFAGCVIPLWRGENNLSIGAAAANGLLETLVLCEGVEDGLSAVLAAPQHRVWAMISLSNMTNVASRLPASCDSVIVHRQNDWKQQEAVAEFERGMNALRASGRAVAEVAAVHGKDLNDTLRQAG